MADGENNKKDSTNNNGYGIALFGRRVIYTDVDEITPENVIEVIRSTMPTHIVNRTEIKYLYDYYKGKQPILNRVKKVREEINNKICVNYANEIISFKVGYIASDPIVYVSRVDGKNTEVDTLNDYMFEVGKEELDQELIEWNHICGTAYRYVKANDPNVVKAGDSPFDLETLDPRNSYIIYSSKSKKKRMGAVTYSISEEKGTCNSFVVYTPKYVFSFEVDRLGDKKRESVGNFEKKENSLEEIPIFEYPANNARLGAFEIVLPLLDAINRCQSNRLDGIEQQVQSFLKFINCELDKDALDNLREYGAIKLKSTDGAPADVDTVKTEFSQEGAQLTKDDLYAAVLTICGMPAQGNGQSVSANNGAILIQNGWSQAEARAKSTETKFKGSERMMLKLILKICQTIGDGLDLRVSDVDTHFTRVNYENVQTKAQVLCQMLGVPQIHPKLAFEASGLFSDPEGAFTESEKHYLEELSKWKIENIPYEDGVNGNGGTENGTVRTDGHSDSAADESAS